MTLIRRKSRSRNRRIC